LELDEYWKQGKHNEAKKDDKTTTVETKTKTTEASKPISQRVTTVSDANKDKDVEL